jgi:hypothetical protein
MVDCGHRARASILAATLALLLVLAAGVAMQGCGSPAADTTVKDFLDAWNGGNETGAAGLTIEGDLATFKSGNTFLLPERPGFSLGAPDVQEETAYVPVTFHTGEGDLEGVFVLTRSNRAWKISLTGTMTAWLNINDRQ